MKTKSILHALLLILLSSIASMGQTTITLNVPEIPQKTNVWCWAACMEMIMKYHGVQTSEPNLQCRLATNYFNARLNTVADLDRAVTGCTCVGCPVYSASCIRAGETTPRWNLRIENFSRASQYFDYLFSFYGFHSNEDMLRMSWGDLKKEIDNCRPFIAIIQFIDTRADKHAVVVRGYEETVTGEKYALIYDPLRSCTGEQEFCDGSPCEFVPCKGCSYKMLFDRFNDIIVANPATPTVTTKRVVGYIHNIYPAKDTTCRSCDANRIARSTVPTKSSKSNEIASSSILVDTGVIIPVRNLDYGKLLNPNYTATRLDSYYLPLKTREILNSYPTPQSKTQELINREWKTVTVRDLTEIPKTKIKILSLSNVEVRLKNDILIDDRNLVPFEYIYYTPLLQQFYRFSFEGKMYLSPTSNLINPKTNQAIAKSGYGYDEKTLIKMLKQLTVDYETDYNLKYDINSQYTR